MEVLFTFFAERYERRSLLVSSNLVFSQWAKILPGSDDDDDGGHRSIGSSLDHPGI